MRHLTHTAGVLASLLALGLGVPRAAGQEQFAEISNQRLADTRFATRSLIVRELLPELARVEEAVAARLRKVEGDTSRGR